MRRYPAWRCALRTPALAIILVTFIIRPVLAATSNWTTDTGGDFSSSANWDNGVPGPSDTAVFRRGNVAYDVQFTHDIASNQLRVGSNTVNLLPSSIGGTYTVTDTAHSLATAGIIIGELAGDRAVVNSYLPTLIGQVANLGEVSGSSGTLNVNAGSVSLTGMIIGVAGTGSFSLTNGATADTSSTTLANSAGSFGTATVDGIGSNWNVRPTIGFFGTGVLSIINGGQVNSSGNINLGVQKTGSGSVMVDGVGSTLSIASAFNVGSSGVGNVSILNGGQVQSGSATIQRSNLLINGSGSTWTNLRGFTVLSGNLTISDGAILNANQGITSGGNATIFGAKSAIYSLGPISTSGQFVVLGGANVNSSEGDIVGGTAIISGMGSAWSVANAFGIGAYANETGNLQITNSGILTVRHRNQRRGVKWRDQLSIRFRRRIADQRSGFHEYWSIEWCVSVEHYRGRRHLCWNQCNNYGGRP